MIEKLLPKITMCLLWAATMAGYQWAYNIMLFSLSLIVLFEIFTIAFIDAIFSLRPDVQQEVYRNSERRKHKKFSILFLQFYWWGITLGFVAHGFWLLMTLWVLVRVCFCFVEPKLSNNKRMKWTYDRPAFPCEK